MTAQKLRMNIHGNIIHVPQKWKQTNCPSVDEKINKMAYTMEYSSVIERNEEVQILATTLMNLENLLSEGSQS